MTEKPKKKVSENSLKNLKPMSERSPSERKEIARKGAAKTNQIKAQKVKRENALAWLWDNYGIQLATDIFENGSIKDKTEFFKAILPKDKQIENNINLIHQIVVEDEKHKQMLEDL